MAASLAVEWATTGIRVNVLRYASSPSLQVPYSNLIIEFVQSGIHVDAVDEGHIRARSSYAGL